MAFVTKVRDPEDKLDYVIDWRGGTNPGLAEDETITTSTWATYDATPGPTTLWEPTDDLTIHDELNGFTDTTATGWVSGGTRGKSVFFTNHIVTDQGRELSYTIKLKIKEQ